MPADTPSDGSTAAGDDSNTVTGQNRTGRTRVAASDLARASYCPRQLYYARREDDRGAPPDVAARQRLAFRYDDLHEADDATLADLPVDRSPDAYRAALDQLAARDDWDALVRPPEVNVRLVGRDVRAVAHKVLSGQSTGTDAAGDDPPPVPTVISGGTPPESGVWEPHAVRAVAVAKALAWERERPIPRALVEYPAVAAVREVRLTVRKMARYRRVLRVVRELDGPPPRLHDRSKCGACEYSDRCGVRTRSLKTLLGL